MASEQADEFIDSLPQGVEAKARVSYAGETTSIDLECDGWKIFTDCRRWNMVAQADCDQGFGKPFMTQDIATINRTLIDKFETLLSQLSRLQTQDCTADYIRGQLNGLAFALNVTGYSGNLPKRARTNPQKSRAERSDAQIVG
jgi:hypothetical protein